jgi:general secretion pathway protein F
MGAYLFKAIDTTGKAHSGMIEAASGPAARQSLRGKGWTPIEVTARAQPAPAQSAGKGTSARSPALSANALTLVTRQMATLLGSGLRIEDALATIASGQPTKVAAILLTVRATVLDGRSLSTALASYPRAFSEYYRASVTAGEQSGKLDHVMAHLASHVEHRSRNRQSVQLALLYPVLLGLVSLAIITMLMTFVVPDIVKVFRDRGADLPMLTRVLIGISDLIRNYGLAALTGLLLLAR